MQASGEYGLGGFGALSPVYITYPSGCSATFKFLETIVLVEASKQSIYKRECQGHFSPSTGRESASLTSSPCSLCEPLRLGFLLSGPAAGLACFHLSCIFDLVATTSIGLRSWQAEWLPGWQHIDLSEARGPSAFLGCPRGYRDYTEAQCSVGTWRLQALGILTLEPERLKNRSTTTRERIAGDGKRFSPETLKRLATSVSRCRSFLLSSIASRQWRLYCAPES
jgi:hypothetical protein